MTNLSLNEIVSSLPKLRRSDLQLVKQQIEVLLGLDFSREVNEQEEELYLFFVQMKNVLEDKGITCRSWPAFRKSNSFKGLKNKFHIVKAFTNKHLEGANKQERIRAYRFYVLSLVFKIDNSKNIPLTVTTIVRNIEYLSETINMAFPGYLENGILSFILRSKHVSEE